MRWRPWRQRIADAEKRLAEAMERTEDNKELIRKSQVADAKLRSAIARNGFGEALLLAMERRKA